MGILYTYQLFIKDSTKSKAKTGNIKITSMGIPSRTDPDDMMSMSGYWVRVASLYAIDKVI